MARVGYKGLRGCMALLEREGLLRQLWADLSAARRYPKFLMGAGLKSYLMSKLDIVKDAYVFARSGNRPFAVVSARVRQPEDIQH